MQSSTVIDNESVKRFRCEGCGANVVFDAHSDGLLCSYCRQSRAVAESGEVRENDLDDFLARGMQNLQPMATSAMQAQCDACGAIVNFTPPETATFCAFCGANIVAQPKAADPLVAPNGVLPFRVPADAAMSNFRAWLASLWFAPSNLSQMASPDKMASIYIPYWTYDAQTYSEYEGSRGDNYTDWETHTVNGKTETRAVTKTRWSYASGRVARSFDDVLVAATRSLPTEYLDRLEPWDLEDVKPYEPAYLSGHRAQAYQLPLDEGFMAFKQRAGEQIEEDCRDDIGGDHQRVSNVDTRYLDVTFKHLLLPVYAGAYRFDGKTYQMVVNARTGEVQGGRPYSWLKITALVAAILLLLLIVISIVRN